MKPVIIGLSGASGSILAKLAIDRLVQLGRETLVIATPAAQHVWSQEVAMPFEESMTIWQRSGLVRQYDIGDLGAPPASGTFPIQGMVVIPCSMATLASITHGLSSNLLERTADVCVKEHHPLVLMTRETPLSAIHLQNMLTLAQLGVTILPPMPAFYKNLSSIEEMAMIMANRALAAVGIEEALEPKQRYHRSGGFLGKEV